MDTMINALEQGWMISEIARVLARGNKDENRGYMVTLANYRLHTLRRLFVPETSGSHDLIAYVMDHPAAH